MALKKVSGGKEIWGRAELTQLDSRRTKILYGV